VVGHELPEVGDEQRGTGRLGLLLVGRRGQCGGGQERKTVWAQRQRRLKTSQS